jgi:hypothetical protein
MDIGLAMAVRYHPDHPTSTIQASQPRWFDAQWSYSRKKCSPFSRLFRQNRDEHFIAVPLIFEDMV